MFITRTGFSLKGTPMPYFRIDNDIFSLRLEPYEFLVYAYLLSCAGKKGEYWPSTNTIARVLRMSQSTVITKIDSLVRRQLIDKRSTTRHSKNGKASTGNNHYYIRSVTEAKMAHERFLGVPLWTNVNNLSSKVRFEVEIGEMV